MLNNTINFQAYEYFFCKSLAKNDDSGRHGVLIPVAAYHMFPNFRGFDSLANENYAEEIVTNWIESVGEVEKESFWRHYHRYPERRITSLSPELLNNKEDGSLLIIAKKNEEYVYDCLVVPPSDKHYDNWGKLFKLRKEEGRYTGAAVLKSDVLERKFNTHQKNPLDELIEELANIHSAGYFKSLKSGDTGIGFTFETLLGIEANPTKAPDYKGIEIKTSRSARVKDKRRVSTGKQTLFSLIPNWGMLGDRRNLVETYGYEDIERERKGIYCTIKVKPNSYGFYLEVREGNIYVMKEGEEVVVYEKERLKEALFNKHKESFFVTAHAVKDKNKEEWFRYDSAIYCSEVSFKGFIELIEQNLLGVDFAINIKNGRVRDHGFLWRIENRKYLFSLFDNVVEVF